MKHSSAHSICTSCPCFKTLSLIQHPLPVLDEVTEAVQQRRGERVRRPRLGSQRLLLPPRALHQRRQLQHGSTADLHQA